MFENIVIHCYKLYNKFSKVFKSKLNHTKVTYFYNEESRIVCTDTLLAKVSKTII